MSKEAEKFLESCKQIETALSQIYGLAITIENGALMDRDIFKTRNEEENEISSPLYSMAGIIKEKVKFCINQIGKLEIPSS